jgi:hypothetical protein
MREVPLTSALLCQAVYGIMGRDRLPAPVAVTALRPWGAVATVLWGQLRP